MRLDDGTTYAVSMPPATAPVSEHLNWLWRCLVDAHKRRGEFYLDAQDLAGLALYLEELEQRVRALEPKPIGPQSAENVIVLRPLTHPPRHIRLVSTDPEPPQGGSAA